MPEEKYDKSQEQQHIDDELENSKASEADSAKSHGEILKQQIIEGQETYDKSPVSISHWVYNDYPWAIHSFYGTDFVTNTSGSQQKT
jgi:hypothetical protein